MSERVKASDMKGLQSFDWRLSYKTSSTLIDGRPLDILHDFYIPAIRHAIQYDRVAGYFRSSSLAAASQGFSAFVGRGGKMRLIVGTDIKPHDVQAILQGDAKRFTQHLNKQLEQPENWPEQVQNGVKLLAWMVANEYLEVRVAFRLHQQTGQPLTFDSVKDGYVHEKWFILKDQLGNHLYGSGTLNESKTALMINAENIDIHCDWWGKTDRQRVVEAKESFENLWGNHVSHIPVMTLPEAVKRRLIKLAEGVDHPVEIDGTSAIQAPESKFPSAIERLKFAVLRDAPKMPGGRFVGMQTAPVKPWPHQEVVAKRLIETWPYSYLLCDEVGLGKTIEAGLAFRSLYLSGMVKRILIAPPASLTYQWQRQMASKMLLSFGLAKGGSDPRHDFIFPYKKECSSNSIFEPDLVIVSTGLLQRLERASTLRNVEPFDIALVDEAHAARRKNPTEGLDANPDYGKLYLFIDTYLRKNARSLWLATATPMQLNPVEVCDLIALTNRVGAFQYDPTLTMQYYEILDQLKYGGKLGEEEWDFLSRVIKAIQVQDPFLWRYLENYVKNGRNRATIRRWLQQDHKPSERDQNALIRYIFCTAPLSRVMLRHTRGLLEIYRQQGMLKENLAKRHIQKMPRIVFSAQEQKVYDQLKAYCNGLLQQVQRNGDNRSKQTMSFYLSFLRLRFASSFHAFHQTIKRRLEKVKTTLHYQNTIETEKFDLESYVYEDEIEDDRFVTDTLLKNRTTKDLQWEEERLKSMLNEIHKLNPISSKMMELLKCLDKRKNSKTGRIKQTVIFTRFYDTLVNIVHLLQQKDSTMRIGIYSGRDTRFFDYKIGKMVSVDREEVKERFLREEIDVLVCTDAAAEGLNLQTADLLVNFDLGWNPMKIEQRIGRIDRIGQKHQDIFVLNLCYVGSIEEIVYNRLLTRLTKANLIVGTQQISLLPVEPKDFEDLANGTLSQEELFKQAEARVKEQLERSQSMDMDPKDLFDIYRKMKRVHSPVDLLSMEQALTESPFLKELGCKVLKENGQTLIKLFGIDHVPDGAMLTTSRKLYEEGLPNDPGGRSLCFLWGSVF